MSFFFQKEQTNKTLQFPCNLGSFKECSTYVIPFFDSHCFLLLWYKLVSDKRTHGNTLSLVEKRDHTCVCSFRHFVMSFRPKVRLILGVWVCGEGNISAFDRRCFDSPSLLCLEARKIFLKGIFLRIIAICQSEIWGTNEQPLILTI